MADNLRYERPAVAPPEPSPGQRRAMEQLRANGIGGTNPRYMKL